MLPASNQGVGNDQGFPDTCNTPGPTGTAPVTYSNTGMNATGLPFLPNIMISMVPGQNQTAKPLMTNGDEAGCAHASFIMPGGNNMGNAMILSGGAPAGSLCNPTQGNNYNCSTDSKLVPSLVNVLMSYRAPAGFVDELLDRRCRRGLPAAHGTLLPARVGQIVVARCSQGAPRMARAALEQLVRAGARSLVLDLRGNPGGALSSAAAIAGLFLDARRAVVHAELPAGTRTYWTPIDSLGCDLPLTVLVDDATASAAEVLAGALQDHGRAVVVGAQTYGKVHARAFSVNDDGAPIRLRLARGARLAPVRPQVNALPSIPAAWHIARRLVTRSLP